MSSSAQKLLHQAMKLPAPERAALVEGLVESLHKPDPSLDAPWLKKAGSRIAAYRAGELKVVDVEEAFAEIGQETCLYQSPKSPARISSCR